MPQNRVSDTITHVTLYTINGVASRQNYYFHSFFFPFRLELVKLYLSPQTTCYLILPPFQNKSYVWHKLRYEIKVTFGEISLKLRQTNWNVARNNVNVVADELSSQIIVYTCLIIDIWTWWRRHTSTRFYVWDQSVSIVNGDERVFMDTPSLPESV